MTTQRTIGIALLVASSVAMPDVAGQSLLDRAKRDEVVIVGDDDPAMARAFKRARAGLDEFLAMAKNPPAHFRTVAVKVGVTDKKATEYFWLFPFRQTEAGFVGTLNNRPELVKSVKMGQEITFAKSEIVDWMYVDTATKRMFGNFTACALLTKEKPEEARALKKKMGIECDA